MSAGSKNSGGMCFSLGVLVGVVCLACLLEIIEVNRYYIPGYRQGQIDSLTGKIKYELVEQEDKTKVWVVKTTKPLKENNNEK